MFFWLFKLILIVSSIQFLIGCQTTISKEETNKKINVAKINTRLGLAYLERHDIQRAKQKLLFALDQAPNMPEAWYAMGYLLESTGNHEKAKKHYIKALALAPERGDVLNNYGTFLCRSGDYNMAIRHFLKAVRDPQYLQPASAYENAGLCALKIPDRIKAMQYFNKALAEDSNRPTALIELAELNYDKGNYLVARHELDQYLHLSPPNVQSFILEQKIDRKIMRQHS